MRKKILFAYLKMMFDLCAAMKNKIQNINWWWHTNLSRGL